MDYKTFSDTELNQKLQDLGRKCATIMALQSSRGRCLDEKEQGIANSMWDELEAVKSEIENRRN